MTLLWLYDSFKIYCERNGIILLSEDMRYIARYLSYIPADRHKIVMKQYYEEWKAGMELAAMPHRRQNNGRRLANTYLRETVGDKI